MTRGHYSIFRVLFGAYLLVHFVQLAPWAAEVFSNRGVLPRGGVSPLLHFPNLLACCDSPAFITGMIAVAAGLSVAFLAGYRDRAAALGLWYVWACLLGRNPLIANPSLPYVGWMLLAHACVPSRRGLPREVWRAVWILLAAGYSYSGCTKLLSPSWQDGTAILKMVSNPLGRAGAAHALLLSLPPVVFKLAAWAALSLELLFAPLALQRRLRPWLWSALLAMHLSLIVLVDFADLSLGMVLIHLFTFDPAWIRPRRGVPGTVLFDGGCGFCHGFVRFVLDEEPPGVGFLFAPLAGEETLEVLTADGRRLQRSAAVLHILDHLGGVWRLLAAAGRLAPLWMADGIYSAVARFRRRLAPAQAGSCPLPEGKGGGRARSV